MAKESDFIAEMNTLLSIIIPVRSESDVINRTLGNLTLTCASLEPEIIIVEGDPRGSTISALPPFQGHGTLKVQTVISERTGRAVQMNIGAGIANGTLLLFLHADTILPGRAASGIHQLLKDASIVCGAFSLGIRHENRAYRLIETLANLRSRVTRLPYGDQAQFFRKDYFDMLGGFADIPLMEDVEIMQRVKKRKGKCRILPEKVYTSARRWEKEGILYCTLRNWTLISLYYLGVSPHRLVRYYR